MLNFRVRSRPTHNLGTYFVTIPHLLWLLVITKPITADHQSGGKKMHPKIYYSKGQYWRKTKPKMFSTHREDKMSNGKDYITTLTWWNSLQGQLCYLLNKFIIISILNSTWNTSKMTLICFSGWLVFFCQVNPRFRNSLFCCDRSHDFEVII